MQTKYCKSCETTLPVSDFAADRTRTPDGLRSICRDCYNFKTRVRQRKKKQTQSPEEREAWLAWKREQNRASRAKAKEAWIAENGPWPDCACGCGTPVKMDNSKREPRKYVGKHGHKSTLDHVHAINRERLSKEIPIEQFRSAMLKMKADKGWTLRQIADAGGVNYGHFKYLMYDKRPKHVTRAFVEPFLKRIAGMPMPPSVWQLKQMNAEIMKDRQMAATLDQENFGAGDDKGKYREALGFD